MPDFPWGYANEYDSSTISLTNRGYTRNERDLLSSAILGCVGLAGAFDRTPLINHVLRRQSIEAA
jgi:hypothetical protein